MQKLATDQDMWLSSTLHRASMVGQRTYERALKRQLDLAEENFIEKSIKENPVVDTDLNEAFSSVIQFMLETCRQCKKYYTKKPTEDEGSRDAYHCDRYHTMSYPDCQPSHSNYSTNNNTTCVTKPHSHKSRLEHGCRVCKSVTVINEKQINENSSSLCHIMELKSAAT